MLNSIIINSSWMLVPQMKRYLIAAIAWCVTAAFAPACSACGDPMTAAIDEHLPAAEELERTGVGGGVYVTRYRSNATNSVVRAAIDRSRAIHCREGSLAQGWKTGPLTADDQWC